MKSQDQQRQDNTSPTTGPKFVDFLGLDREAVKPGAAIGVIFSLPFLLLFILCCCCEMRLSPDGGLQAYLDYIVKFLYFVGTFLVGTSVFGIGLGAASSSVIMAGAWAALFCPLYGLLLNDKVHITMGTLGWCTLGFVLGIVVSNLLSRKVPTWKAKAWPVILGLGVLFQLLFLFLANASMTERIVVAFVLWVCVLVGGFIPGTWGIMSGCSVGLALLLTSGIDFAQGIQVATRISWALLVIFLGVFIGLCSGILTALWGWFITTILDMTVLPKQFAIAVATIGYVLSMVCAVLVILIVMSLDFG